MGFFLSFEAHPRFTVKYEYAALLEAEPDGLAFLQPLFLIDIGVERRSAYQELSGLIRDFTHDVTGIKVQNYSLREIRRLGMPQLTALVQEYYEPEFARQSMADLRGSLFRTRKAIEQWY